MDNQRNNRQVAALATALAAVRAQGWAWARDRGVSPATYARILGGEALALSDASIARLLDGDSFLSDDAIETPSTGDG